MPLLNRNGWIADDYQRYDEFFAAPAILVPPETSDAALQARAADQRVGVEIPNSFVPKLIEPVQDQLSLIAIQFPRFSDGRGFSIGRMLREQGYKGTLRAVGPILPDEFAFARACGFDEVEMSEEHAARALLDQWVKTAQAFSVAYHYGPNVRASISNPRAQRRQAA